MSQTQDQYLIALDNNEKALGYLPNAKNVEVRERLNGESLLSFEMPFDVADAGHIELEGYIKHDNQLYVIKEIEQSDAGRRNLVIRAVHVYIELLDEYIDRVVELFGTTAESALTQALQGTPFAIGNVDSTELHDIDLSEMPVLKAVQEIREKWDLDLWFDNRTVYLGNRGSYNGVEIRYGKNMKSFRRPSSSRKVITRLYPYGRDGLTIEGINNGVKYIDSVNIGNYARPKIAEKRWNEITDVTELKSVAERYLDDNDDVEISYQVDLVELSKLGYKDTDFEVGDDIVITHLPFNIQTVGSRVVEYTEYPYEPRNSYIVLSNYAETTVDLYSSIKRKQNGLERFTNVVNKSPATITVADRATSKYVNRADFVVPLNSNNAQDTIAEAINTLPSTGGKVVLMDGTYNVNSTISLPSNTIIEGQGQSTVIYAKNIGTQYNVVSSSSKNNTTIKSLKISIENVSGRAIEFTSCTNMEISDITTENNDTNAISLENTTDSIIQNCKIINSGNAGIYNSGNDNKIINCTIDNPGDRGIRNSGSHCIISGNIVKNADSHGISDAGNESKVVNNICRNGSFHGIFKSNGSSNTISNNTCVNNKEHGIAVMDSNDSDVTGNLVNNNGEDGIYIYKANNNSVINNSCKGNGSNADLTYSNIRLFLRSDTNNIQNNTCRIGSNTNRPKFGIEVASSDCDDNVITNNDLKSSGASGSFSDAGTGTITTAGNRT